MSIGPLPCEEGWVLYDSLDAGDSGWFEVQMNGVQWRLAHSKGGATITYVELAGEPQAFDTLDQLEYERFVEIMEAPEATMLRGIVEALHTEVVEAFEVFHGPDPFSRKMRVGALN